MEETIAPEAKRPSHPYLDDPEEASYRGSLYRLAAQAFYEEPSVERLQALLDAAWSAQPIDDADPGDALLAYLRTLGTRADEALRVTVASEYAELFVGPRPPRAPFYESMYLGYPNRLFTGTTRTVRSLYERAGFAVTARNRVPDDCIAYELEFMAHLCERQAELLERLLAGEEGVRDDLAECLRVQRIMACIHLGAWTGPFAERVASEMPGSYYAAWARFAADVVAHDADVLVELGSPEKEGCRR